MLERQVDQRHVVALKTTNPDINSRAAENRRTSLRKIAYGKRQIWHPPASQEDAVDQLHYKAESLGANGIKPRSRRRPPRLPQRPPPSRLSTADAVTFEHWITPLDAELDLLRAASLN
jgi:hypothetical protein